MNNTSLPDWARWVAQDASGAWWAFEAEPNRGDVAWYENEVGRYQHIRNARPNPDWARSLRKVLTKRDV